MNRVYHQLKSTKKMDKDLTRTDLMIKLSKLSRKEDKAAKVSFLSRQDTAKSFAHYANAIAQAQAGVSAIAERDKVMAQDGSGAQAQDGSEAPKVQEQEDEPRASIIQEEPEDDMVMPSPPVSPSPSRPGLQKTSSIGERFKIKVELPEDSIRNSGQFEDSESPMDSAKRKSQMHAVRNSARKKVIQVRIATRKRSRSASASFASVLRYFSPLIAGQGDANHLS